MFKLLRKHRADESGAVTVDWVVLTSVIVGLGVMVLTIIGDGTLELSRKISSQLAAQTIATYN